MEWLSGTGALAVITAVIVGLLLGVILWDRIGLLVRPIGLVVVPVVLAIYAGAALLMAAPADLLIASPGSASEVGLTLVIASGVALLVARRLRPHRSESAASLGSRALILLACCTGARYVTHVAGYPVDGFWPVAAVSLAAFLLTAVAFDFLRRPGVLPLVSRAFVLLATAGLVAAWALANDVAVFGDPETASSRTLWVMLLIEPLGLLAAILLVVALVRHFAPDVLPVRGGVPRTGEIWNAFVTFEEDASEGKDRPVLVLSGGDPVTVVKITSQDRGRSPGFLPLPRSRMRGVLVKDSWLQLSRVTVPAESFRSYRGPAPSWVLNELRGRAMLPAAAGGPGRIRGWIAALRPTDT